MPWMSPATMCHFRFATKNIDEGNGLATLCHAYHERTRTMKEDYLGTLESPVLHVRNRMKTDGRGSFKQLGISGMKVP